MTLSEKTVSVEKKLLKYSIGLYLSWFLLEVIFNVLNKSSSYLEGKVLSSFSESIKSILPLILFDASIYLLILTIIYLLFAYTSYLIVSWIGKIFKGKRRYNEYVLIVFVCVNSAFIACCYFFNQIMYPYSRLNIFDSAISYEKSILLFYVFVSLYFALALYLICKNSPKYFKLFLLIAICYTVTMGYALPIQSKITKFLNKKTNSGPNVIIIGIDSLRPDHLSCNGYDSIFTPNIDNFVQSSILCKNTYTPLARTFPSWTSILTGCYPKTSGACYNLIKRKYLDEKTTSMPAYLKEKCDYYTVHCTDETRFCNLAKEDGYDKLITPVTGITDFVFGGFHDFSLINVFFNNPIGSSLFPFKKYNRAISHLYNGKQFIHDIESLTDILATKKSFFLSVHFCAPHWPYTLSAPYIMDYSFGNKLQRYDSTVEFADKQVGILLNILKEKSFYDNSIIILLSDHGESFENHWGHGTSLYDDSQNRILLSIKPLENIKPLKINSRIATVDIFPTIVDMLKLDSDSLILDGESISPCFKNEQDLDNDKPVFLETGFHLFQPSGTGFTLSEMIEKGFHYYECSKDTKLITVKDEFHNSIINFKQKAVLLGNWKLIFQLLPNDVVKSELFNIKNDPLCLNDVKNTNKQIYNKLLTKINQFYN